ncbi:hypothetical protein [Cupriavidus sp. D39]|uniref:hypothetical protein n=1 Tax=Cupriavidus sp. D39 TaxID=2997877 RepID=UPI00226FF1C4|nr:hypothetical protein [Cupriavidus sp. D39]MCY0856857.1 hypothetical protein [Cupriavidus sp. D39]
MIDSLRFGSQRYSTHGVPNFFAYLAVTLFIDSLLEGNYASSGAFRTKLAKWLDVDNSFQQLKGVACMWEELVGWLDGRIKAGEPFRRLVLPEQHSWTHIGYTRRLSFPNRTDIRLIERFLSEHPGALSEPHIVLTEFWRTLLDRRASWGLTVAFEEFRQSYLRRRRALADHRFWRLLTRVRASHGRSERSNTIIEMIFDEDGDRSYCGLSEYDDDRRSYRSLDDALLQEAAARSGNLGAAVARGVLFFRQCGIGRWIADAELGNSANGVHVGLHARHLTLVGAQLGRLLSSSGWSITQEPQAIRRAEEALIRARLLITSGEQIFRASVSNGIRVKGAWLGRPNFLPTVEADTTDFTVSDKMGVSGVQALHVTEGGQLITASPLAGSYVVEPALLDGEERPQWSLRLQFAKDALPHLAIDGARHRLPRLNDWSGACSSPIVSKNQDPLKWESGRVASEDLLEAVYADGVSGWEEAELVGLIRRAGLDVHPWSMLRCLGDAGLIEPRLREGWRGRSWTLVAPRIVRLHMDANELVLVEGALCTRLVEDFQLAVDGLGGTCFRRLGISELSPPTIGAKNVPAEALAQRLSWPLVSNARVAGISPLALETANRHAELYQLASIWDWDQRRFKDHATGHSPVRLTRRIHPGGRDHDIFRVEHHGQSINYLSRTAAICAAHAAASVPLFEIRENRLVRLAHDGGVPDALATDLRRRRIRTAGPIDDAYAYPATESDAKWLASLLPGCVAGILSAPKYDAGQVISTARRSAGRLRPLWRGGRLLL